MSTKVIELANDDDAQAFIETITKSSSKLFESLTKFRGGGGPQLIDKLKFTEFGCDPLNADRPLNVIEQINQTATYLVSFCAARVLFDLHKDPLAKGLRVNLGTSAGTDIESMELGVLGAEVFAAVRPSNNNKLNKDIDRMKKHHAKHKYVCYYSPNQSDEQFKEMQVVEDVRVLFVNINR
ncbi:MAG: hypothetical protein KDB68_05005 [Planctomycetes bacterium]|nr:hypothetical protein [Planctomycetota bacterium]